MLPNLTPDGLYAVEDIARRNGVSFEATLTLLEALMRGNGFQAQFSHPELGGMGQWSQGGMIMIGDMFNQGLKYRVDSLCTELANLLKTQPMVSASSGGFQSQSQSGGGFGSGVSLFFPGGGSSANWWPAELGVPASSGAQNDLRYAFFPNLSRLAITKGGDVKLYDTGNHYINGFSQQQGGDQSLTFSSQFGVVRVADLPQVRFEVAEGAPAPFVASAAPEAAAAPSFSPRSSAPEAPASERAPAKPTPATAPERQLSTDEILRTIESLGELRKKDILTEEEFVAKKTALLNRL